MAALTETEKAREPRQVTCAFCGGRGHVPEMVNWSDGWGMTQRTCPACEGSGEQRAIYTDLIEAKRRANAAEQELLDLKVHVALYLSEVETGAPPNPPLARAPRPGVGADLWREYLGKAIDGLPRVVQES